MDLHLRDAFPHLSGCPLFWQHELYVGIIHPTDFVIEPKFFNMLVQTWNTIFFALVFFGGVYLCANDHLALGILVGRVGRAGAYFCLRQAQHWPEVRTEDIPQMKMQPFFKKKDASEK